MEGLFVLQLLAYLATFPSVSEAAVGCRTAQWGNCVAVNFTQWVCVEHYEDMMVGSDSARKLQYVSPCSSCVAIIQKRCCPQCTSLASSGEYFYYLAIVLCILKLYTDCRCSYETNDPPNTAACNCLSHTQQYNWDKPPCSDLTILSSNSPSPSHNILSLAPRPIHNASFNLTISWPEMSESALFLILNKLDSFNPQVMPLAMC